MKSELRTNKFINDKIDTILNTLSQKYENIFFELNITFGRSFNHLKYVSSVDVTVKCWEKPIFNSNIETNEIKKNEEKYCFPPKELSKEIFELLKKEKVGFVEFNFNYAIPEFSFSVLADQDYDIYNNIDVFCHDANLKTKLLIGEEYYICDFKQIVYNQDEVIKNSLFEKYKLISIDYEKFQYQFNFEKYGLIESFTRGIVDSNNRAEHRLDYILVSKSKREFIQSILHKISKDFELTIQNKEMFKNYLLKNIINEIDDI